MGLSIDKDVLHLLKKGEECISCGKEFMFAIAGVSLIFLIFKILHVYKIYLACVQF